jgi:hypothetical protein
VPALEPVPGIRVVAAADAIDRARWSGDFVDDFVDVIRIAPDEALGLGATAVQVDDPDAIVEEEAGFAVALLGPEFAMLAAHTDWPIPEEPGTLAQGKIAGVPAKLLVGNPTLLVVQAAYADELRSRLGW